MLISVWSFNLVARGPSFAHVRTSAGEGLYVLENKRTKHLREHTWNETEIEGEKERKYLPQILNIFQFQVSVM